MQGPIVVAGYWQNSELAKEVFASGRLHTGDLARANVQGYLTIVDRKKDMIITGGINVYPADIESVLGEFPGVTAAAIGVPDKEWARIARVAYWRQVGFRCWCPTRDEVRQI